MRFPSSASLQEQRWESEFFFFFSRPIGSIENTMEIRRETVQAVKKA
jgi:hypothetical protein